MDLGVMVMRGRCHLHQMQFSVIPGTREEIQRKPEGKLKETMNRDTNRKDEPMRMKKYGIKELINIETQMKQRKKKPKKQCKLKKKMKIRNIIELNQYSSC